MDITKIFEEGYRYALKIIGISSSANTGQSYVSKVQAAVDEGIKRVQATVNKRSTDTGSGFLAEEMHAATFNVSAVASESSNRAMALKSNKANSVDIVIKNKHDKVLRPYQSKYGADAETTADYLARVKDGIPSYGDVPLLGPSDQTEGIVKVASEEANNPRLSELRRKAYKHVSENTTGTIRYKNNESQKLTRNESKEAYEEIRDGEFDPEKYGLSTSTGIKASYIFKQAAKAGLSAAIITMLFKITPDIFKGIGQLIKRGTIDVKQLKETGKKAISGAPEGFMRGFLACYIQILCNKGAFGEALKTIDPTFVGPFVALTIETLKNAIELARGKQTIRGMGSALIDGVAISASYFASVSFVNSVLAGATCFLMPVVGFLLGSLIGSALSAAYNIGKNKFLSFCVDSGFTCFGLVDQDYTLPTEALKELGIDTTQIERVEVTRTEISRAEIGTTQVSRTNFETIQLVILKRGIIGVNKVGYLIK